MPTLTGSQTGTPQNDLFIGNFEDFNVATDASETGIFEAVVNTFGGDDTVEGTARLAAGTPNLTLAATGIASTVVNTGDGNDTVLAQGTTTRFVLPFTDPRNDPESGNVTGNGLVDSRVYTGAGDDTLTFIGEQDSRLRGVLGSGVGAKDAIVSSGSGADTITASGRQGILNTRLFGGAQQDSISIAGEGSGAIAAEQSIVNGGSEDDAIAVSASGSGTAVALRGTRVLGGSGNDKIDITSSVESVSARGLPSSRGGAVEEKSIVNGGLGDDLITIRGSIGASGDASGFGIKDSRVIGAAGADTIDISVNAGGFGVSDTSAAFSSIVNGGDGDDFIELSGFATGTGVTISAAKQSTIIGGEGNDTMLFRIGGTTGSAQGSAGLVASRVIGGSGDDRFTVEVEQFEGAASDRQASYDISGDTLLAGGEGDDVFDVGIGRGRLNGGAGSDLAVIDYFDAETMEVRAIANGVSITGMQTRNGTAGDWTQTLVDIEVFQIGTTQYTTESLISEFSV